MKIKTVLNHNIVLAVDGQNRECVLTGRGIGFGKKAGDTVEEHSIERMFAPKSRGVAEKFSRIVEDIPLEHIKVTDEIINMAKRELPYELDEKIYITLTDHLSFALNRHQDGIDLTSTFKWEMKQCYPREYRASLLALDIVNKRLGVRLPEDEAAYITFHFVNAGAADSHEVQKRMELIHDILDIVRGSFAMQLDEDSHACQRFLTHLNYFSRRVFGIADLPAPAEDSDALWQQLSPILTAESQCADTISEYVQQRFKHPVSKEEKSYLIMHLHNMLSA